MLKSIVNNDNEETLLKRKRMGKLTPSGQSVLNSDIWSGQCCQHEGWKKVAVGVGRETSRLGSSPFDLS